MLLYVEGAGMATKKISVMPLLEVMLVLITQIGEHRLRTLGAGGSSTITHPDRSFIGFGFFGNG